MYDISQFGMGMPGVGVLPPVSMESNYLRSQQQQAPQGIAPPGTPAGAVGLGMNLGTANLALGGLQTIGNLWQAWEANKLAKEQFEFGKKTANVNLANQTQTYNTTLNDRIQARGHMQGMTADDISSYVAENSLKKVKL